MRLRTRIHLKLLEARIWWMRKFAPEKLKQQRLQFARDSEADCTIQTGSTSWRSRNRDKDKT